jgi:hypothetical protein
VRAFANASGKRAKKGPIDAAVIARFIETTKPKLVRCRTTRRVSCAILSPGSQILTMIMAEHLSRAINSAPDPLVAQMK